VTRAPLGVRAIELDPWSCDRGPSAARRLLQPDTTREHHRGDRPTPAFRRADHALRALSRPWDLPCVRQVSGSSARGRVKPKPHASADGCQPRVHGPGAIRLSTIRDELASPPEFARLEPPFRAARWRLYPDPIRSSTSCRETAAPSKGGFARRVLRTPREYRCCRRSRRGEAPCCVLTSLAENPVKDCRRATPARLAFAIGTGRLRAAPSEPPRRGTKLAAPEVLSIDEPVSPRSHGRSRVISELGRGGGR